MEGSSRYALSAVVFALGTTLGVISNSTTTQAEAHARQDTPCIFDHTMLRTATNICRPRALSYPAGVDSKVKRAIYDAALTFGVPYPLFLQVATCESGLNPHAVNGSHRGLFQFLPQTFRRGARRMRADTGIKARSVWKPLDASYVAGYLFATRQAPSWQQCLSPPPGMLLHGEGGRA